VARMEEAVGRLNVHAAQMQGQLGYLAFKTAVDAMSYIRGTEDPAATLQTYLDVATQNARKLHAPDGLYREIVQSGIDAALQEHVSLLMRFASELPGAQRLQG